MRIGISTFAFAWSVGVPGYPVKNSMTARRLVEKAREWNVPCVQFGDNLPLHRLDPADLDALKKQADRENIAIEVGTRGLKEDNIHAYLGIAERLESPILRVVIDAAGYEPAMPEIIETLRRLEPEFRKRRIRLAIENHDRFRAVEFLRILAAVDTKAIGICLDSVNSMGAGEGVQAVTELLGPHAFNLHVKEFTVRRIDHQMGFQIEGRPLGQGMLPLEWMLDRINPACTSALLEQWVPPEKTVEATIAKENDWAIQSIEHLKKFLP